MGLLTAARGNIEAWCCFFASFVVGCVVLLRLQPTQGEATRNGVGLTFLVYRGPERKCVHLHHWILCLALAAVVAWTVWAADGRPSALVLSLVGLALGAASSDLVYTDAAQWLEPCPGSDAPTTSERAKPLAPASRRRGEAPSSQQSKPGLPGMAGESVEQCG